MSRALTKDTSFVPDLGDTGTIGSLHFGNMGNDLLLAAACFNTGIELIKVAPGNNRTPNNLQSYQSQVIGKKETATPCVAVQVDPQNRLVYGATCDGSIQAWVPEKQQMAAIGSHNDIVSHIRLAPQHGNILISSSYDGFVKYWDIRTPGQAQGQCQAGNKILAMDYQDNLIVAALDNRKVVTIDIRKPTQIMSTLDSGIEEDTAGIVAMYQNHGYVVSSLDSRANVHFLNTQVGSPFIFRAHRVDVQNQPQEVHTFSALACHPQFNTLATCGTDGSFITWDFYKKQRLTNSERFPNPISACAFSPDGATFAFASSYNWYKGANGDPMKNATNQQQQQSLQSRIGLFPLNESNLKYSK